MDFINSRLSQKQQIHKIIESQYFTSHKEYPEKDIFRIGKKGVKIIANKELDNKGNFKDYSTPGKPQYQGGPPPNLGFQNLRGYYDKQNKLRLIGEFVADNVKNIFYLRQLESLKTQLETLNIPLIIQEVALWKDIPHALNQLCLALKIQCIHANVEIGGEVPPELYQAVAEVLAIVYNKKHRN